MKLFSVNVALGWFVFSFTATGSDKETDLDRRYRGFTTEAYTKAAASVLLAEANAIAHDLQLEERFPITASSLIEMRVNAPYWSDVAGMFGVIYTSNYCYSVSKDNALSAIVRKFGMGDKKKEQYLKSVERRHAGPLSLMNSNLAYTLATQWLAAAGIDVKALDRDSKVEVNATKFEGNWLPIFGIRWMQPYGTITMARRDTSHGPKSEPVAFVELEEPERVLLQMYVSRPQYIKRKRLAVPDRELLLQKTEDPEMRQMWITSGEYKNAAVKVMVNEVNKIIGQMHLHEQLPIGPSNLTKVQIRPPFASDRLGSFGAVWTQNYVYVANVDNKLNGISKNVEWENRPTYLGLLRQRYARPMSELELANTNRIYALATNWLAALSADIKGLERDCTVQIKPWDVGDRFVPLYEVRWSKPLRGEAGEFHTAASVQLLDPDESLDDLEVFDPEYLTRPALAVTNRDELLQTKTGK
jgi:hypothetical protein